MGTSSLEEFRVLVHRRHLDLRRIDDLIASDSFQKAWLDNKKELTDAVNNFNVSKIHKICGLNHVSFLDLRTEAAEKKLKNYSRMSRQKLLEKLNYV